MRPIKLSMKTSTWVFGPKCSRSGGRASGAGQQGGSMSAPSVLMVLPNRDHGIARGGDHEISKCVASTLPSGDHEIA